MTNQLFRDYLDGRIPGHGNVTTTYVTVTPQFDVFDAIWRDTFLLGMQRSINIVKAKMALSSLGIWVDYGAQRGLTGLERAQFNDAIEQITKTTTWDRAESARMVGLIMDAAERAELEPLKPKEPTDPRSRGLWMRDHRNTGPKPPNLTQRGRITKYRTKG